MVFSLTSRFSLKFMESQGFYANDLPGLVLADRPLEFFAFRVAVENLGATDLSPLLAVVQRSLNGYQESFRLKPLHLVYLDLDGHGVAACEGPLVTPLFLTIDKDLVQGNTLVDLTLHRIYSAQGSHGTQSLSFHESMPVYLALGKFMGFFQQGWSGLFHVHNVEERSRLFREFHPHKIPLFGHKESLDQPVFSMKLGKRDYDEKVWFREVRMAFASCTLDEVLAGHF